MSRRFHWLIAGLVLIAAVEFTLLASGLGAPGGAGAAPDRTPVPGVIPLAADPPTATPPPGAATSTPAPPAGPQLGNSLPFIIEGPPPEVVEEIRNGDVPGVTLTELGQSLRNVQGATALSNTAPFAPDTSGADGPAAGAPFLGTDRAITLLVQYPDLAANPGSTQASYQSLLFGSGPGSMATYFAENSYGQYDLQGTVANWVTVPNARTWYADYDGNPNSTGLCNRGYGDDYGCGWDSAHNTQTLIRDAVLAADPFVDFSAYAQGGVVRNLMIIHAGQGAEANPSCRVCPWSVAWWPAAPVIVDGVSVVSAFVAPEYTYTAGDSKIGVYAHEFGHLAFGLPDLYDTDYSSSGIGRWSLMSFGSWNNGGATPAQLDAWSKIHNGWITPTTVGANGVQSVAAAEGSPAAIKLWTNGTPGSEYFLVENRQQTGFDQYLPGNGLLVWHIDDAAFSNTDECHPIVLLVSAANGSSLPCNTSSYGTANDPWPGGLNRTLWNGSTVPSSRRYSGAQTGVALQSISASGPSMTANVLVTLSALPNDNASAATDILGMPFSGTWNSTSATVEGGESSPCGSIGKTLWYRYTPPVSPPSTGYDVTVDTIGSDFDTVLAVYEETGASPPASLSPLMCNDNASGLGLQSRVYFTAFPGTVYYIQAGGAAGASGVLAVNADFGMPPGGISGTVTDGLGTPIAGASVWASSDACCGYGNATTGPDGTYTVTGLQPGSYRVRASGPYCPAPSSPPCIDYASEYYDDTYDWNATTLVPVSSGATTTGIDFALGEAGRISGVVTDDLGTPIAGASVWASRDACCGYGGATTGPDGTYTVTGLPPGNYRVQASGPYCTVGPTSPPCIDYASEYYDDTYDSNAATLVPVSSGATTPGIDFALAEAGRMSGTVTNELGTPIAGANVSAEGDACCGYGSAMTGPDGSYTVTGLLPGNYRVRASGSYCPAPSSPPCIDYASEYYDDTYDWNAATLVSVAAATTTTGIDFALAEAGRISGVVTDDLGTPIAGASVWASSDACCGYGGATTAADGTYVITSLSPGSYRVRATPPYCPPGVSSPPCVGYASQYFDGTPDGTAATLVPVTAGSTTPAIDFSLPLEGRIEGTVTDAAGNPLSGLAGAFLGGNLVSVTSLQDGDYSLGGLDTGDYVVAVIVGGPIYYYPGVLDLGSAATNHVSAGTTTSGVDFVLGADPDNDGVSATGDNCPSAANADQTNSDQNFLDQTPPSLKDDRTWPNSDAAGDACDTDDDNDGLSDTDEASGAACSGIVTNPAVRDTDGDRFLDGAECALGNDPTNSSDKPTQAACAAYLGVGLLADTDADRLRDFVEFCNYNTDPNDPDTDKDQDGLPTGLAKDGCEAASFNEDRVVTAADQILMAYEMVREISPSLRLVNMDINKDSVVSSADQLILAMFIAPPGQCP
jgi:immune inhibitor A